MELSYNFKFGELWLSEFGGVTTTKPHRDIALYDFTLQDTAGKDGSDFIDNHRYKNVAFTREVGFNQHRSGRIQNLPDRLIEWLAYHQGYQDFEDTLHEGLVTKAVLTNFPEVVSVLSDKFNTATLKFSRQPFWYRKDSMELGEIDLTPATPSIAYVNPFPIFSEPLILFFFDFQNTDPATIQYSITTGGVTKTYTYEDIPVDNSIRLFVDCEEQEVRSGNVSANNLKYLDYDLPGGFATGPTTFQLLAGKSRLRQILIAPRWRCL